eukprot:1307856-Rhodomonas_salina.4
MQQGKSVLLSSVTRTLVCCFCRGERARGCALAPQLTRAHWGAEGTGHSGVLCAAFLMARYHATAAEAAAWLCLCRPGPPPARNEARETACLAQF